VVSQHLVDEIDIKIIELLQKDSSNTFVDISKHIGISDGAVNMRIRRLLQKGIIGKFTINVDNGYLGYGYVGFIGINTAPVGSSIQHIIDSLSLIDEILEIHEMYGRYDLFMKICAKSLEDMRNIIENKISKLPDIRETELLNVLKTTKEK
jgi:Lrp/AsnC family transcriptional regulator, regulator for asnA, asnC and gidA